MQPPEESNMADQNNMVAKRCKPSARTDASQKRDSPIHGDEDIGNDVENPNADKESDHLTEEEENKLLAEEDDLDVIDCYTEDFDSDMENDFCRREAKKEKVQKETVTTVTVSEEIDQKNKKESDKSPKAKEIDSEKRKSPTKETREKKKSPAKEVDERSKSPTKEVCEKKKSPAKKVSREKETSPTKQKKSPEKVVPEPEEDDDQDVIQLCDELSDTFLEDVGSSSVGPEAKPEISLRVKDESEKERMLSEPLVKQLVIPEICVSDEEDDKTSMCSQESLSLQIDAYVEKATEIIDEVKRTKTKTEGQSNVAAGVIKNGSLLNNSNTSEGGLYGCHQEDPDVLKLKLDLYQDMGGMDYEAEDKTEEGEKLTVVRVKAEPCSPLNIHLGDDIPTIELTSTDEEVEVVPSRKKSEEPAKKNKRGKKRKSKKKEAIECIDLRVVSSEDSFPIVADSTVSVVSSRTRNDSEGSEGSKALRNRMIAVSPEKTCGSASKKAKSLRKSLDSMEPPAKRKKKVDPAMMGYRNKRRKSVGRSVSKCSVISGCSLLSSIADEDMIVLSANEVLLADPVIIGAEGIANNEKTEHDPKEEEPSDKTEEDKAANDSKGELMHSLDLQEAIAKELVQEAALEEEKDRGESDETSFPIPTTDIALEDMLDSFIDKEANNKSADLVFHSISPEEKFLMDSLFADCEKQTQQVPSQEHLESLKTIMDDGKPLVEPANVVEPIAISYTICNGDAQSETVHMQLENVASASAEISQDIAKGPKAPNIKIIQNYQKYPFQAKPPKKSKGNSGNSQPRKGRGRKKRDVKDDTDEEYLPSSRKRYSKSRKPRNAKPPSMEEEPKVEEHHQPEEEQPPHQEQPVLQFDNGEEDDDGTATTSTVCRNMPTLEEDLALSTSSDEGETFDATSKECITTSPSKISSTSTEEGAAIRQQEDRQKSSGAGDTRRKKKGSFKVKRSDGDNLKLTLSVHKRGRPRLKGSGRSHPPQSSSNGKVVAKRGRPKGSKNRKISDFYPTTMDHKDVKEVAAKVQEPPHKESIAQQSLSPLPKEDKVTTKPAPKRKRKRLTSSSTSEDETASLGNTSSAETEPELQLSASTIGSEPEQASVENGLETTQPSAEKMDNLQIVISPLTEDKIREINTPQKCKSFAKACQTEISGLTWSIDLNQIDFRSEYFEKLRILLNNGARSGGDRSFNGVDIPNRSTLQRCLIPSPPRQQQPVADGNNNRSSADELLFQRALGEVELGANNAEDRSARQRLERVVNSVRTTFRIPKVKKQASTSPQDVTSSTPHLAEPVYREDLGVAPLPSTSHPTDRSQQPARASSSFRPPNAASVVQRTITNDYVDDQSENSENGSNVLPRDRQEFRQNIMMQDRFEAPGNQNMNSGRDSAVNMSYMPPTSAENGPPGISRPIANPDPRPSPMPPTMPLESQAGLPSRAELLNVRRTIRNDMPQQQPQPQLVMPEIPTQPFVQPFLPEPQYNPPQQQHPFAMLGGFQPALFPAATASFNRGGPLLGYPRLDPLSMFNQGMTSMQQQQQFRSNPSNMNDFLTLLWEQFKEQQQPRQQALIQPPVQAPVAPIAQPPVVPITASSSNQFPVLSQLLSQMNQISAQPPSAVPQFEPQGTNDQMEIIGGIFGCIDFLTDRCSKPHCRYPHVLPSEEEIFQKLVTRSRDVIMMSYRFVSGRDDLFIKYFPVYAGVMGRNNMRHQLVNTIADCEHSKRPIQYYKYIVEGLKTSGTSAVQAVQLILEKHTKKSFNQINVLIELILDTGEGIPTFLRMLEEFFHVKDFYYDITSVNRLLEFCVLSSALPTNELATFVCKLILKVPAGGEHLVNTRVLLEFIQKVRVDPALALDVEDIVKKYGNVVMRP
ncbi:uncharacterized protein LOC109409561 isoform X1 [Aedes albopictus]|uniref:C3H1-type domain-containing protein n=1 Tax=Aedes albopictus TaxID=7160 RepID=A0ABM1YQE4_AEDAL